MVIPQAMIKGRDRSVGRINSMWRCAYALALLVCLFISAPSTQAQQASTPTRQRVTATAEPPARQAKLQALKPADAALPVIAVVHRLSGWRLQALLMRPDAPVAATVNDQF